MIVSWQTDHPHIRGENCDKLRVFGILFGPSPHTWGKRLRLLRVGGSVRTIPTYVGKTKCLKNIVHWTTDHPHIRGENTNLSNS